MARPSRIGGALLGLALAVSLLPPLTATASGDGAWYVVRFSHRISGADREALEDAGGRALGYRPRNGYSAWLHRADLERVEAIPTVSGVRALTASEKVDRYLSPDASLLTAVVYGGAATSAARSVASLGRVLAVRPAAPDRSVAELILAAPASAAAAISSVPAVLYVGPASTGLHPEDERSDQIVAGNIVLNQPVAGYETWLAGRSLSGTGVRVAIVDTGIDETHPDLAGRVVARVEYGDAPVVGEAVDSGGHGTHVSGIVGGAAANNLVIGRVRDSGGFLYGLGMAPAVQFIDQNAISTTNGNFLPAGLQTYSRDAVRNGAVAWNASWHTGQGTGAGYIDNARVLDIAVRDADWQTPGAEPLTMVFSAGNAGSGASTMTSPKEAKNLITVASSLNSRAGNINNISSFSSRGPARDGRILPTVAAPGDNVISSRSLTPGASCNTPVTDGFGLYAACSGTSMAAPHVTGSVALITEWWRREHAGATSSPAMNKALLINSATDMGTLNIPNGAEGWGRVNLGSLFDPSAQRIYLDQSLVFTELGASHSLDVSPADPSKPLKVTLVWTDAPGEAGADPALVNDLDLKVEAADGTVYNGNVFSTGTSVSGGDPDRLNNMENVFLPGPSGTYRITVSAFNLPGDGVPFLGDGTDQDFALVVSNAIAV